MAKKHPSLIFLTDLGHLSTIIKNHYGEGTTSTANGDLYKGYIMNKTLVYGFVTTTLEHGMKLKGHVKNRALSAQGVIASMVGT